MRLHDYRIPNTGEVFTSPGSRVENLYTPQFNGSHIVLVKSGTVDIQDRINSYAPYCDIRYMLQQLRIGDNSVLSSKQPLYGDFSGFPSHPVDALNFIDDVQRTFDRLPEETKASCNNDWRVYFTQLVTGQYGNPSGVPDNVPNPDNGNPDDVRKDVE